MTGARRRRYGSVRWSKESPWGQADKAATLAEIRRRKRANESLRYGKTAAGKWGAPLLRRAETLFSPWTAALLAAGVAPPAGAQKSVGKGR